MALPLRSAPTAATRQLRAGFIMSKRAIRIATLLVSFLLAISSITIDYGQSVVAPSAATTIEGVRATTKNKNKDDVVKDTAHWPWNPERMGDGCKHVYLDLGANIGVHNRFLFQPELYPDTPMQAIFDAAFFGVANRSLPSEDTGICAFAFEANPLHAPRLKAMEKCFLSRGHRLKVVAPYAVSDDANQSLYFEKLRYDNSIMWGGRVRTRQQMNDLLREEFGNALSPNQMEQMMSSPEMWYQMLSDNYTEVRGVDIAAFINQHIKDREYRHDGLLDGGGETNGTVVAKLDVEGSEFVVLPRMEELGVLCRGIVDVITTEFHDNIYEKFVKDRARFPDFQSFVSHFANYHAAPTGDQRKCASPTNIRAFDSEHYHLDDKTPLEQTCPDYGHLPS